MLPAGPEQQPLDQSDPPNRNWKPQGNVGFVLEHGTPPLPLACLVQLVLVTEVLGVTSFWWQKFLVAEVLGGRSSWWKFFARGFLQGLQESLRMQQLERKTLQTCSA